MTLAEISDKMPSTLAVVLACLAAAAISVAIASAHRGRAWVVLVITFVVGMLFAVGGYHESFADGSFTDAVWRELGGPWVAASIVGPLLPASAVAALMVLPRRQR